MGACLLLGGCDKSRTDVLQEFPPPRLAREVSVSGQTARTAAATCDATWRLFGRTARETHRLYGEGSFSLRGDPEVPVTGSVTFETDSGSEHLPKALARALRSRDENAPWVWRLAQVESASSLDDSFGETPNAGVRAVSEVELNAVRTRQSHTLTRKLTPRGGAGALTFETTLRVDMAAHHVTGVALADESAPRRSDLVVQCRLNGADTGE